MVVTFHINKRRGRDVPIQGLRRQVKLDRTTAYDLSAMTRDTGKDQRRESMTHQQQTFRKGLCFSEVLLEARTCVQSLRSWHDCTGSASLHTMTPFSPDPKKLLARGVLQSGGPKGSRKRTPQKTLRLLLYHVYQTESPLGFIFPAAHAFAAPGIEPGWTVKGEAYLGQNPISGVQAWARSCIPQLI